MNLATTRDAELPMIPEAYGAVIPATVAEAGDEAAYRFFEFFTANIRNPNTRTAYLRATCRFFAWTHRKGVPLVGMKPPHVAAHLEELLSEGMSRPSVKQALSALKMLFDWFVVGQVLPVNP